MCLAEALLRIPDKATRDALIRDKISNGNWQSHIGRSPSLFVNAATWGLLFTGKLVSTHNEANLSLSLNRIIGKSGEPLIRKGVDMAMRLMGEQFVTGKPLPKRWPMPASWKTKVSATLTTCWAKRPDRRRCAGVYGVLPAGDPRYR